MDGSLVLMWIPSKRCRRERSKQQWMDDTRSDMLQAIYSMKESLLVGKAQDGKEQDCSHIGEAPWGDQLTTK